MKVFSFSEIYKILVTKKVKFEPGGLPGYFTQGRPARFETLLVGLFMLHLVV